MAVAISRFIEDKNVKPKRTRLGPNVTLDDERCILCSRCVRFSKEVANDDVLGFVDRGTYSTLTCFPGKELSHNYSLNTVDICPVGALTSTDFRFKMRVWFLKRTHSICTESSVGANTEIWSREGKIYRITPRRNDEVNDTWMTDTGRALYKDIESEDRLIHYTIEGVHKASDEAAAAAAELLKSGKVAIVGSANSSVEEQFFYKAIAERSRSQGLPRQSPTATATVSCSLKIMTPNLRGALVTGLISELPSENLEALARDINSGAVKTILAVNEDLTELGINKDVLAKAKAIYVGSHANRTSEVANIVLPSLMVFEKDGSFINQSFRIQRFKAAIPGPRGVQSDFTILDKIAAALAGEKATAITIDSVWERMTATIDQLSDSLRWHSLPEKGVALDATAFLDLGFVETKNLKYDPVAFKEAHAALAEV